MRAFVGAFGLYVVLDAAGARHIKPPPPDLQKAYGDGQERDERRQGVNLIWVTKRQLLVYDYHGSRLRLASKPDILFIFWSV